MSRKPSVVNGKENLLPIKAGPHYIPANNTDVFPCTLNGNGERLEFSRNLSSF
jgi:hypothetical protein